MGWIDVAIPGVFGLLMILAPNLFLKSSGSLEKDTRNATKLRVMGALLMLIAGVYWMIKFMYGK